MPIICYPHHIERFFHLLLAKLISPHSTTSNKYPFATTRSRPDLAINESGDTVIPVQPPQQRDFECLRVDALQSHPLDCVGLIRMVQQTVNSRRTAFANHIGEDICLPVDLN
jgi:hypothetical protein